MCRVQVLIELLCELLLNRGLVGTELQLVNELQGLLFGKGLQLCQQEAAERADVVKIKRSGGKNIEIVRVFPHELLQRPLKRVDTVGFDFIVSVQENLETAVAQGILKLLL